MRWRARQAEAASSDKVVFATNRTTGTGVNNPTSNRIDDVGPVLSPEGTRVAHNSFGKQTSNPQGDDEVYRANTLDGSAKKDLSNSGDGPDHANTGANGLQNKPVVRSAKTGGGKTTTSARLTSAPAGPSRRSTSYPRRSEKFIGRKAVTTDGSGNVTFSRPESGREKDGDGHQPRRQHLRVLGVRVDQLKAFLAEPALSDPGTCSAADSDTLKALAAELSDPETVLATTWLSSILPSTRRLIIMPI
jgi:hypothetical protein